jgi:hypothetical protein
MLSLHPGSVSGAFLSPFLSYRLPTTSLTLLESYRFKIRAGRVFSRSNVLTPGVPDVQGVSPLDATPMCNPKCVDLKRFTEDPLRRKSFSCNTYQKTGVGGGISSSTSHVPTCGCSGDSIRPIAARALWCHNPQRLEISLRSGETTPLLPVSKTKRADIGNLFHTLPVTDSDSIGVASRA